MSAHRPFEKYTTAELVGEFDFRANQAEQYEPTAEAGTVGEHLGFVLSLVSDVCDLTSEALVRVLPDGDEHDGDEGSREALVRYIARLERDNELLRQLAGGA